jgi:hypothetical protein
MFRHSVTAGECLIPGTLFLKKQFKPRMNADRHRSEEVAKNQKSANRGKTLFIKICFPGKKTSAKERKEHEGNIFHLLSGSCASGLCLCGFVVFHGQFCVFDFTMAQPQGQMLFS